VTPTPAFRPEHLDILRLLVIGAGPKLIAHELNLPPGTVKNRIERMRQLARCLNTAELVYAAGLGGWLESRPVGEADLTPELAVRLLELAQLLDEDAPIGVLRQAAGRVRAERGRGR
jgi:DNA-binding CsgD family transcriptional regulator